MRRFRKVRHVPLPLLAVIMAAILFAELARCEREGAKETAAEAEKSVPRRAALTFDDDVIIGLSQEISYKEAVSMI